MIRNRFRAFLILISIAIIGIGCSGNSSTSSDSTLARSWKLEKVTNAGGSSVRKVSADDFLKLAVNGKTRTFTYNLDLENIAASGTWVLKDSVLALTYDLKPVTKSIDSMVFDAGNGSESVLLFSDSTEITRITPRGLQSKQLTRYFRISLIDENRMVFDENGITFTYSYTPAVMEGSFSVVSLGRGLLGLLTLLSILYLFSSNRRNISWKLVGTGLALQLVFAVGVLKVDFIKDIFEVFGNFFVVILSFTQEGSKFVFGDLVNPAGNMGFIFAFQILPTIIFFSALTSLLFYLGILQKIVYGLAWVMSKTMRLSGSESLAAAANIFLGQTEAPLLVKPYIANMTRSEILCLMIGGMANIAGGVMAAYIGFLGGDDPAARLFFAKHLLAASVMSAPAAIVASKMLMPQDQEISEKLVVTEEKIGRNMLEAISIGTTDGLKLAVNVAAMLLVFIGLVAMTNYILRDFLGELLNLNEKVSVFSNGRYDGVTLQFILGYVCAPITWLMGVSSDDMVMVGQLLGEKTILNEFVAYMSLGDMKSAGLFTEQKSMIIATYILCGFANFASIGIQIGGIGSLAPNKRTMLAELGFRALLGGTIASLFTAVIVGMLI